MSTEPADPRIAVVASVLADAHFGDSSEDVRDGFRNLARHALAAADAVITPPDAELLEEIVKRDEVTDWADMLAYAVAPQDVIGEHSSANNPWQNALDILDARAAVVSPPPSDEELDLLAEKVLAVRMTTYMPEPAPGTFRQGVLAVCNEFDKLIAKTRAVLSPSDTPTEYEQVGWLWRARSGGLFFHQPETQGGIHGSQPCSAAGCEPVFRRVRDEGTGR